jgi:cyclopropane fatty-acyl-phospholipid synthase-like methyltransferase
MNDDYAPGIPLPPQEFIDAVGGGDFLAIARHLRSLVIDHTGLDPRHRLLDIGCGCGRLARELTNYFSTGSYDGIDVVLPMVEWCQKHIGRRYDNFHFHHANLKNTHYSEIGGAAENYTFPFEDATFDRVVATSVFTHLLPASAAQYAREIARLLRREGLALITIYLMNDEYRRVRGLPWVTDLEQRGGEGYWVHDRESPEAILGYDEDHALRMLRTAGLTIETISYGNWTKHLFGWTFQDLILAAKAQTTTGEQCGVY